MDADKKRAGGDEEELSLLRGLVVRFKLVSGPLCHQLPWCLCLAGMPSVCCPAGLFSSFYTHTGALHASRGTLLLAHVQGGRYVLREIASMSKAGNLRFKASGRCMGASSVGSRGAVKLQGVALLPTWLFWRTSCLALMPALSLLWLCSIARRHARQTVYPALIQAPRRGLPLRKS